VLVFAPCSDSSCIGGSPGHDRLSHSRSGGSLDQIAQSLRRLAVALDSEAQVGDLPGCRNKRTLEGNGAKTGRVDESDAVA
jgi:hypothetical protein